MYRLKNIKYLATTAMIIALLFVIGYTSALIFGLLITSWFGGQSTLQVADSIFIAFTAFFPGPMMLFAGCIAFSLIDLVSGVGLIVIPITILIRILIFVLIKLCKSKRNFDVYYLFLLAILVILILYPLYYYLIFKSASLAINEFIVDSIQGVFSYIFALIIYFSLQKIQNKTNNKFWDDSQFK